MINPLHLEELDELPEQTEESRQRFQITDIASLNWALRKLSAIKAKKDEVNKLADAEIERIENYRKRELDALQGSEDFFNSLIADYAIRRRNEDPKFKSEKTPYGSIRFRKQQPKWHYDDEKLLEHLKANDLKEFIRVKEEPNKAEIKKKFVVLDDGKVVDTNGQEIEAIKVEFQPDALDVKVE